MPAEEVRKVYCFDTFLSLIMSTRKKVHLSMLKGSANAPSSGKKARGCPPGGWPKKPKKGPKGPYVPTGKPRGCPPGGWPEKPRNPVPSSYVPTGQPVGRPPKNLGPYVPTGKPRGRPPKNKAVENEGELNYVTSHLVFIEFIHRFQP